MCSGQGIARPKSLRIEPNVVVYRNMGRSCDVNIIMGILTINHFIDVYHGDLTCGDRKHTYHPHTHLWSYWGWFILGFSTLVSRKKHVQTLFNFASDLFLNHLSKGRTCMNLLAGKKGPGISFVLWPHIPRTCPDSTGLSRAKVCSTSQTCAWCRGVPSSTSYDTRLRTWTCFRHL